MAAVNVLTIDRNKLTAEKQSFEVKLDTLTRELRLILIGFKNVFHSHPESVSVISARLDNDGQSVIAYKLYSLEREATIDLYCENTQDFEDISWPVKVVLKAEPFFEDGTIYPL